MLTSSLHDAKHSEDELARFARICIALARGTARIDRLHVRPLCQDEAIGALRTQLDDAAGCWEAKCDSRSFETEARMRNAMEDDVAPALDSAPSSPLEREHILALVNSEPYRDPSPKQIVPRLADQGEYIGSESTIYRVLEEAGQKSHRERVISVISKLGQLS